MSDVLLCVQCVSAAHFLSEETSVDPARSRWRGCVRSGPSGRAPPKACGVPGLVRRHRILSGVHDATGLWKTYLASKSLTKTSPTANPSCARMSAWQNLFLQRQVLQKTSPVCLTSRPRSCACPLSTTCASALRLPRERTCLCTKRCVCHAKRPGDPPSLKCLEPPPEDYKYCQ